jgi:replicative DNA helicase
VPITTHFNSYVELIKEKAKLRKVLALFRQLTQDVQNEKMANDILISLLSGVDKITGEYNTNRPMVDVYEATHDYIARIKKNDMT